MPSWQLNINVKAMSRDEAIKLLKTVVEDAYANDFSDANNGWTLWGHIAYQRFSSIRLKNSDEPLRDFTPEKR